MPVRLSNSSVLVWPDRETVDREVRRWAAESSARHTGLVRLGYFGSYARGNWGVGSDIDLVAIVEHSEQPFIRRAAEWDTTTLPVPADLLVYTASEWERVVLTRAGRKLEAESVWVYPVERI